MEYSHHIILFGSGHLAYQVGQKLRAKNLVVVHLPSDQFQSSAKSLPEESAVEYFRRELREARLDRARAVYIVDDEDRYNIQFAMLTLGLNESIPVVLSLFNADLAGYLLSSCKNLKVRNPALLATKVLVDALHMPNLTSLRDRDRPRHRPAPIADHLRKPRAVGDLWIAFLVSIFFGLMAGGTMAFRFTEQLSLLDAFYFTVTLMTTTGFGDISLRNSSALAKLLGAGLMLGAVAIASLMFSFLVDHLFRKRSEIALGRKRYRLKNHVILCGLGRVGYQVAKELLQRNETVLVLESNPQNRFLESIRSLGAKIFVGDATIPSALSDAGVSTAAGLFSLINDDLKNLEVGLNARSIQPDLRLILRIFDKDIAEQLKDRLDIHFARSTSAIAAEEFAALMEQEPKA